MIKKYNVNMFTTYGAEVTAMTWTEDKQAWKLDVKTKEGEKVDYTHVVINGERVSGRSQRLEETGVNGFALLSSLPRSPIPSPPSSLRAQRPRRTQPRQNPYLRRRRALQRHDHAHFQVRPHRAARGEKGGCHREWVVWGEFLIARGAVDGAD